MLTEDESPPFGSYREALNEIQQLKENLLKLSNLLDSTVQEVQAFEQLAYDRGYTEYLGIPAWKYLEGLMRKSGERYLSQGAQLTAARDEIDRLVKKLDALQAPAMKVCDQCIRVFKLSGLTPLHGKYYCQACKPKE